MLKKSIFIIFLLIFISNSSAMAQYLPDVDLGKGKKVEVPPKPMYTYLKGQKTALTQDLVFIALSFADNYPPEEFRHKYYKDKIHLVISELRESELLKEGFYGLRLVPGASVKNLDVLTEYMKNDRELDYISRVFKEMKGDTKDLLVPLNRIRVKLRTPIEEEKIHTVYFDFPVKLFRMVENKQVYEFIITDRRADTVELANGMHESGYYYWAEPVMLRLTGQKITDESKQRIMDGMQNAISPEEREKMRKAAEGHQKFIDGLLKNEAGNFKGTPEEGKQ